MSVSTQLPIDGGRLASRSRHVDAGVVTEMARSLRRDARRVREGGAGAPRDLGAPRAIEAARLRPARAARDVTLPGAGGGAPGRRSRPAFARNAPPRALSSQTY